MELHRATSGSGPTVVLVHGFTQTSFSWRHVAELLEVDHTVVAVDAPGHGGSSAVVADLSEGAELVGRAGGRAVYVGYSMGGRLSLRLALDRPDLVAGLVLVGATAGIDDASERQARRRADHALADHLEAVGVTAFLDEWLAQDLFAGMPDDPEERAARRTGSAAGLAASLRRAGTGTMDPPWWSELGAIEAPTVVAAGERDAKFTALGRRIAGAIGANARFESVAGAGHAAHLHDPVAVVELIRSVTNLALPG